ncbi:stage II sporulation protein R [Bacillus sp. 31A1R]|uniref:Stage II sporulation protein R n=1 Tax=Robertmurraya mangrovi TaxID=3098077 RepID=A0ABU5IXF1_9BACI|nr:stage II sporulation protein R [Bacillus sp. 31A1R]MDZ5471796.1 stage II sporulation protein R [Bacillus sp. 31A1R]
MKTQTLAKIYILILSVGTILSLYIPKNEVVASDAIVIPNEAIRLRILANSDLEADQELKREVRDAVNAKITEWVSDLTSLEDARSLLQSRLPEIEQIARNVLEKNNSNQTVKTDFGRVDFPTKLYGEFLYPAGEYEAILITLGEGKGANWWCVLFPPLCFLDFSNGVAVSDGFDEEQAEVKTAKNETEEKTTPVKTVKEEKVEEKKSTEQNKPQEPVFVEDKEEDVEVKFFLKELWTNIFG